MDMFGHAAEVTINLFRLAVYNNPIRVKGNCAYVDLTKILIQTFPQPWKCWHSESVPMARLSVRLIADEVMKVCTTQFASNSRQNGNYTKFTLTHELKKIFKDSIQVSKQREKFVVIITYFTFYSMLFLEDKAKIQGLCAN